MKKKKLAFCNYIDDAMLYYAIIETVRNTIL